jgi:hypothetical protein
MSRLRLAKSELKKGNTAGAVKIMLDEMEAKEAKKSRQRMAPNAVRKVTIHKN